MQRSILSLAALSALAAASPISPLTDGQNVTFSVPQVSAGRAIKAAPPIALLKAISKYGGTAPSAVVQAAAAAQQSGSVTATPSDDDDDEYVCAVTIGDQTLNLDFDTGSSDLWVFSTLLPSSEQSGHNLYKPSSADKETGETWSISYGDNSGAAGVVYADKVVVGKVTATSQAVEAATSVSSEFISDTASDGLLGLGFSSINTVSPDQATTFFDTVKSSLAKPLFTADLKKGEAGSYDFGFIDSSKYTGSITYVDADNSEGYWGFTADGYAIGSDSTVSKSINAIADTGTTLLLLDDSIVDAYYAKVSGAAYSSSQGGYIFSCSATLPSFTAVIGGTEFTIPSSYLNYGSVTSTKCFGGLQSNSGVGLSIFGDIFLKSQFVVFEGTSTPKLGFAAQ